MRTSGGMLERSRCGCLSKEQEGLQRNRRKLKLWDQTVLKTQMKKLSNKVSSFQTVKCEEHREIQTSQSKL